MLFISISLRSRVFFLISSSRDSFLLLSSAITSVNLEVSLFNLRVKFSFSSLKKVSRFSSMKLLTICFPFSVDIKLSNNSTLVSSHPSAFSNQLNNLLNL